MLFGVFLAVVAFLAYRATVPEERLRLAREGADVVERLADLGRDSLEPFHAALRLRMRWPVAAPVIVFLNIAVYLAVATGPAGPHGTHPLLAWGASTGPLTTNGEWWRLVSATFVHDRVWALLINMAVLVQVGFMVERLAGSAAFVTVYLGAGALAGLASIATHATA